MMQYSAVLSQLCLVKSDETLFLVMYSDGKVQTFLFGTEPDPANS